MMMALGHAYAGERAAVGTSGGGFSLMVEGLSLAGQAELPIVVVLGQRTGPSTGLPTYTAQADLRLRPQRRARRVPARRRRPRRRRAGLRLEHAGDGRWPGSTSCRSSCSATGRSTTTRRASTGTPSPTCRGWSRGSGTASRSGAPTTCPSPPAPARARRAREAAWPPAPAARGRRPRLQALPAHRGRHLPARLPRARGRRGQGQQLHARRVRHHDGGPGAHGAHAGQVGRARASRWRRSWTACRR